MADLIFYTNPMSRGQTVRWMLEEVGEPYDTEVLDYTSTMKAEPYLSVNPMGKVPAIKHKGKVVTEVAAICCYLAEPSPQANLAPPPADAPITTAGSSSLRARSRLPSATRPRAGNRRPSASGCSATAITTSPSVRSKKRRRQGIYRRRPFHRRGPVRRPPTSISCSPSTCSNRARCSSIMRGG